MSQSRDVQVECAIAYGRSTERMLAHGYTRDDIRRGVAPKESVRPLLNSAVMSAQVPR